MSSRGLTSRPRSKTDHQTWTLPRGAKTSHPAPGMTWAQDDISTSSLKRSYMSNGPARPAPLPPIRASSIKPVRKAPPPPIAGSKTVKKSSPVTNYPLEPPPIPSSPRPTIARHRSILESEGHSKSLPPSPQGSSSMLVKKQDLPAAVTSSPLSFSPPPPLPSDCEELYELTSSFKMKDDTPPPLPNRPVSVSSRPSSASSIDRPPPPPKTNPPGPRPPPPPPPPPAPIPQLPPKPDKYKSYMEPQEDSNGGYCDVDSAVQLKAEYELSQKAKQAMPIEVKAPTSPPFGHKPEEEFEEDVYEQMASHIVEDDYIVMSPVNTLLLPKKKKDRELSDSIVSEPGVPVLPPKPRQLHSASSQVAIAVSSPDASSETRQKSPKNGPKPGPKPGASSNEARKRSLPQKSSAFCLPTDHHPGTPVGLLKTIPKNKTSAPHFPPPSPPPPLSFGQVKVLPKNKSSAPHLPPPTPCREEEEEIQEDYEPVKYDIEDKDNKDEDQDLYV